MRSPQPAFPDQESTFRVKSSSKRPRTMTVSADARGIVNHAGAAALRQLADRLGFGRVLSAQLPRLARRRLRHDPGDVITDLVVSIADGGDCLSDLRALRHQPQLFGQVASTATAWRQIDAIGERELAQLRDARRQARARAWQVAGAPEQIVLDIDATLVTSHSEKELAKGNFKGGFGFHPLTCYLEATGEALAAILRPGNAGSNTASDHVAVLEQALHQLPDQAWGEEILVRCDSAGATHDFLQSVHDLELLFSVGFDMTEPVRDAILGMGEIDWSPAIRQDGTEREGAQVCELTSLDLRAWPPGTRAICRRERPHPGAQLTFTDHQGWRFQVFITNQQGQDIALLEARHRARARCEDLSAAPRRPDFAPSPSSSSATTRSGWSWCSPPKTCSATFDASRSRGRLSSGSLAPSATASSTALPASSAAAAGCWSVCSTTGLGAGSSPAPLSASRTSNPPDPASPPTPPRHSRRGSRGGGLHLAATTRSPSTPGAPTPSRHRPSAALLQFPWVV